MAAHDAGIPTVQVLSALALAGDLGRSQPMGHVFRTTIIAAYLAREMDLNAAQQAEVFYTALLVHAGCTAGAPQLAAFVASDELAAQRELCLCDPGSVTDLLRWMRRNVAPGAPFPARLQRVLHMLSSEAELSAEIEGGCSDVGSRIAQRLGMPDGVQRALFHICETWSGKGPHKLKGAAIPLAGRVVNGAVAIEVLLKEYGRPGGERAVRRRRGRSMDPDVADAFSAATGHRSFWESLAAPDPWPVVLQVEPDSPLHAMPVDQLDAVCAAFADFTDLKAARFAGHSRAVAALCEAVAKQLGLPEEEQALARRAGLVHDIGLVGVPLHLLDKTGRSLGEEERYRSHVFFTESILSRVLVLDNVAKVAGMHHEAMNGSGFQRGLSGRALPMAARILAVADAYREAVERSDRRAGDQTAAALEAVRQGSGSVFDPDCAAALVTAVRHFDTEQKQRAPYPANLTKREVEVLRLAAAGLTVKHMARHLVVSEATARHHLEHIYAKIEVASRAGAVLFAAEHGLVDGG